MEPKPASLSPILQNKYQKKKWGNPWEGRRMAPCLSEAQRQTLNANIIFLLNK